MKVVFSILWIAVLVALANFGVTLSWVLLAGCAAALALAGLAGMICARDPGQRCSWVDAVVVAALGYFALRAWTSPVWDLAKEDLMLVGVTMVAYSIARLQRGAGVTLGCIAALVVLNATYVLSQQLGLDLWQPIDLVSRNAEMSPDYGLFQDYGGLGNGMAMSAVVLIAYAGWAVRSRLSLRIVAGLLGMVAVVLALVSGSRSAVISIGVASIVLTVLAWLYVPLLSSAYRNKARASIIVLALVGCAGVSVLGYKTFEERAQGQAEGAVPITNIRMDYWGMAVEQGMASPLTGTGARSFSYESNRHWREGMWTGEASPEFVHNEYLQVWADYGLIGFMAVLLALGAVWGSGFYHVFNTAGKRVRSRNWLVIAGLLGVVVAMVHSLTDFPLRLPWNACLAALCLGWCVHSRRPSGERVRRRVEDSPESAPDSVSTQRRTAQVLFASMAALTCVAMGGYALKETWAGVPLMEVKQVREDGAWSPEGKSGDVDAYAAANQRAGDFRRSQHLGELYHSAFLAGEKEALAPARAAYEESQQRHPYNPVPRINLALLAHQNGDYEDADVLFRAAEPYAPARDWWYEFYLKWAINEMARAQQALETQQVDQADAFYSNVMEIAAKGTSASKPLQVIRREVYAGRILLEIQLGDYTRAMELWKGAHDVVSPWIMGEREGLLHRRLGEAYLAAAQREWMARKPALAKELFTVARQRFLQDRQVHKGQKEAWRLEKIQYIEAQLNLLKSAGF